MDDKHIHIDANELSTKEILTLLSYRFENKIKEEKNELHQENYIRETIENIDIPECETQKLKQVPQHFFFIWLGMLNTNKLEYPRVWIKKNIRPHIYCDSSAYLSGFYKKELSNIAEKEGNKLLDVQNDFFYSCVKNEEAGPDATFIEFLRIRSEPGTWLAYSKMLLNHNKNVDSDFTFTDINTIDHLFFKNEIRRFYLYEIILRNNLAAASDILRLLILYRFGGVYSDFDTLPDLSFIFKKTSKLISHDEINLNVVDIIKSEMVLSKINKSHGLSYGSRESAYINGCLSYIKSINEKLLRAIDDDLNAWNGTFERFDFPIVHPHTGKISASKNKLSEFNNNMLAAHAGSKGVRIALREMIRRYRYLEKHACIFSCDCSTSTDEVIDNYLERLRAYRLDGTDESENVTLILSGPSFLLEVILGVAFSILSLNDEISPLALSYALRETHVGIALDNQTMFTLEHTNSSWM